LNNNLTVATIKLCSMKYKFFLFVILGVLIHFNIYAQEFNKVYYNSNWVVTSIDNATFYRISGFNSELPSYDGEVTDYYIINNQIEMIGNYQKGKKNGEFTFYYPNGSIKMKSNYNYNERTGYWVEFFSNGKISKKIFYDNNTEKLLEFNDSLGNSLIKKEIINYSYFLKEYPENPLDFNVNEKGDKIEISGGLLENFREGKWKVKKNQELYATLTYSQGVIIKGYFITEDSFGDYNKTKITNNITFPLIIEPVKFYVTENYYLEPKAVIKTNYLIKGLYQHENKTKEKVKIGNYDELLQYIHKNFNIRSSAFDKFIINLSINNGVIDDFSTVPKLSEETTNYLKSILETIDKIEFTTESNLVFEFKVEIK